MKQAKRPAEGEGKMTEIAPDFDAFIHAWARRPVSTGPFH
jgi:hypothetical protein